TLQERVYRTAFEGGWKACVLAGADCMQDPAANAFLKTLEEPPPRTVFLLLTDSPQRLLPTIISRCQVLEVSAREGGVGGETEALVLGILADEAGGTMAGARMRAEKFRGLLKALKDTATAEAREEAKAERGALGEGTEGGGPDAATVDARAGARYREARMRVMRTVLLWYRDILVRVCGGAAEMLYYQSHRDMIEGLARKTSYRAARGRVVAVTEMYDRMERNVPEKAVLHAAFVKLAAPE
ncbi:MAG: hypothetical protein JW951_06455, partial [Lentisphaerae bacterium]|nr:hypothetical protein [Lentisphaerota bacterium]